MSEANSKDDMSEANSDFVTLEEICKILSESEPYNLIANCDVCERQAVPVIHFQDTNICKDCRFKESN